MFAPRSCWYRVVVLGFLFFGGFFFFGYKNDLQHYLFFYNPSAYQLTRHAHA